VGFARRLLAGGLLVAAVAVVLTSTATGRAYTPPSGHVFAGLTGGTTIVPYRRMVGKHPPVFEIFTTWNTPTKWLSLPRSSFRARLALHISTSPGYGRPGVISPRSIALGRSDKFLVALNRNIARSRRIVYIRLMAEMDGYWNAYAPFDANGSFRGPQNSPHEYVQAWRRTVVILRGRSVAHINRVLRRLRLPRLAVHIRQRNRRRRNHGGARLPHPKVAFIWDPQDAGSPDIPGNQPSNFWPGGAYVDWVGTDFYASAPNFSRLSRFYSTFGGKPFVLSEWALYGQDNPGYVHALFAWVRSHWRVRMLNYYQGFTRSSQANLAHYPRSRAALREELRARKFLAYAPEYAHPKHRRKHHRPPPETPPRPPQPGPPPNPPASGCVVLQLCLPKL
jgi:hypothetical protein